MILDVLKTFYCSSSKRSKIVSSMVYNEIDHAFAYLRPAQILKVRSHRKNLLVGTLSARVMEKILHVREDLPP